MKSQSRKILYTVTLMLTTAIINFSNTPLEKKVQPVQTTLHLPVLEIEIADDVKSNIKKFNTLYDKTTKDILELKVLIKEKKRQDSLLVNYYVDK